jgi:hypothetical protein
VKVRRRMFLLSFDPYHHRTPLGLTQRSDDLPHDATKSEWYAAEQALRNQIDRTYARWTSRSTI